MAEFKTSTTVACPVEQAFDFLIRPANAVRISPPALGLVFTQAPEVLEIGSRFEFKVQGWGQVQTLQHEVISLDRPRQFIEQQVKGPFKKWVHEHSVLVNSDGEVVVFDRIEFEPPGGLIGLLITSQKIIDHLEEGFYHRHQELRRCLEVVA